ncbi:MAG TPA: protein kinase [Streptosporangiaceae bacterium]|nr:protein kinase [Streptosporangiaceae bacterium]
MTVQEERIPERLGPYRLRERLGEGGMGVVYLATDPAERLVAVKALRRGVPGELTARRRLAREFETMRRVHSPFVAEVLDADVDSDPPYIVTRYVPGRTVEEVVAQEGPLTGLALLRLARGLACALTAVHAAGVVHRDLKPANVMIVDGEPVVIDFGIAQAPDSTRLTQTGMFMGTPGYLAPEVIEGSPSGPAADVHSWGATVAFAATGRPPFGSGTFEQIFFRIVNGQPDIATLPSPLVPLVLQALARDPARRPGASDLAGQSAGLDPARLVPALVPNVPPAGLAAGATVGDMAQRLLAGGQGTVAPAGAFPPSMAGGLGVAVNGAPAPPAWQNGGTRQLGGSAPDNFADLLPPVSYSPPAAAPGQPDAGASGAASRPRSPRTPLVLATVAMLIGLAILLPVAGTIAALAILVLLRSVSLASGRLTRRRSRQGASAADAVAILAFLPLAIVRSLLRLVLMLPLAALFAAVAAAITFIALPGHPLGRAGAYAAGALVACYALGPGSRRTRQPLSTFFGSVTRSPASALAAFISVGALATAVIAVALSTSAVYWPVHHINFLPLHLDQHLPWTHGLFNTPKGDLSRHALLRLLHRWGIWPFG